MLYKICVPARKQCEYGRKRSEAASRGGDGDGIPSEKRTCAPKRRGGVHKASDPDVSHAGSCDGHGGGIFIFNDTATTKIYPLSLHAALPVLRMQPVSKANFRLSFVFNAFSNKLRISRVIEL